MGTQHPIIIIQNTVLKDIIIDWKVTLINLADRYSHGFIVKEGRELEQTATKKYQPNNAIVCSVLGFFKKI